MADQGSSTAKGGKILGMPRTTGILVIGGVALVVGYFIISRMSGSKTSGGQGGGGQGGGSGGGGGGSWYGPGQHSTVRVIKDWQGHHHRGRG